MSDIHQSAVIKVFGIGGGGGNAVSYMAQSQIDGVTFHYVNTDAQALSNMPDGSRIQIGSEITRGLGAGAKPEIGEQSAMESRDAIAKALENTDMVFVTAGMGGGTGTGAAPVVASIAREMGILTVGVCTTPFNFEGKKRMKLALEGINNLKHHVDSLITIPNDRLLSVLGSKVSLVDAFNEANSILYNAVQGISDLIVRPGMINVDFADVRTVMSEMGISMMGSGIANGENRAEIATNSAIYSPLLNNVQLNQARGILINVTSGPDLSLGEFNTIGDMVEELASPDATVVVGTVIDHNMQDEVRVTLVATGLDSPEAVEETPVQQPKHGQTMGGQSFAGQRTMGGMGSMGGHKTSTYSHGQSITRPAMPPQQAKSAAPQATKQAPVHEQSVAELHKTISKPRVADNEAAKAAKPSSETEMLDIPAFLRRQSN